VRSIDLGGVQCGISSIHSDGFDCDACDALCVRVLCCQYSARGIEQTVGAGKEATFDYTFRPDQRLEPLEFWLSAFMIYNNTETDRPHRTFFFNSTIELIEKPSDMNFRRVFTYFLAFAAAGLVGYVAFQISSPKARTEPMLSAAPAPSPEC
jgi:hypothetical protein